MRSARRRWMCPGSLSCDRLDEFDGVGNSAEDPVLHLDHVHRRIVIPTVGGGTTVFQQDAFVSAIVGLAHRRVNANVRGDSSQNNVRDSLLAKNQVEVSGAE